MLGRGRSIRGIGAVTAAALAAGLIAIAGAGPAGGGPPPTVVWKGETWELKDATAVVNIDDTITLSRTAAGGTGAWLKLDLPTSINDTDTPWVEFSYIDDGTSFQGFEVFVNPDSSGPRMNGGSIFACTGMLFERFDIPENEETLFDTPSGCETGDPIGRPDDTEHTIYVGKRADGTTDVQFDGVWYTGTHFLDEGVGDYTWDEVLLRWRAQEDSGDAVYTDFDSGSDHVAPDPATPDGAIRASGPGQEFKQFGFTSDTAVKQQTAKATAGQGESSVFKFRVENIGDFAGPFTVTGDGPSDGFRVKYYDAAGNQITSQVLAGTYELELGPGQRSAALSVRIKPSGQTAINAKARPVITFEAEDGSVDVLRAQLKRV